MKRREPMRDQFAATFGAAEAARIRELAAREERSAASVIRRLVRQALDAQGEADGQHAREQETPTV